MEIPAARRLERPAWINLRTILGLTLFAIAFVTGQRVLTTGSTTVPVWIAARDLPAGAVLGPTDLRPAEVNLPPELTGTYVSATQDLTGSVLTRTVRRGELLAGTWVSSSPPSTGGAITIPLSREHAVGGALRPGDLVDVYATFDAGDLRSRTDLIVREAEVLEVVSSGGLVAGDDSLVGVTIAIDPDAGAEVAGAIRTAEIDLVRVSGSAGSR